MVVSKFWIDYRGIIGINTWFMKTIISTSNIIISNILSDNARCHSKYSVLFGYALNAFTVAAMAILLASLIASTIAGINATIRALNACPIPFNTLIGLADILGINDKPLACSAAITKKIFSMRAGIDFIVTDTIKTIS